MLEENIKIKIFGGAIRPVWLKLLASGNISFTNSIQGRKLTKIYDGNNMKVFYPNGRNERFQTTRGEREDYVIFELDDNSKVIIRPDYTTQHLIFDFKIDGNGNDLVAIRETVLNFVDYS